MSPLPEAFTVALPMVRLPEIDVEPESVIVDLLFASVPASVSDVPASMEVILRFTLPASETVIAAPWVNEIPLFAPLSESVTLPSVTESVPFLTVVFTSTKAASPVFVSVCPPRSSATAA